MSWRTLTNLRTHRQIEEFLKLPAFVDIVQDNPKFAFKYLTSNYIMQDLNIADRAGCFLHHYQRLYESLPDRLLRQVLTWGVDLCDFTEEGTRFTLKWGSSRPFGKEGEMSILLLADGEILFTISFTIVPGRVVKSAKREVILISRIQGTPGWPNDKMRAAQRALHKLRFGAVLLAGLEGLATAFGIDEIACVSAKGQISYSEEYAERFKHAYDDFFADINIQKNAAGFFSTALPIEERSIEEVKDHKARARARRALKKKVSFTCYSYLSSVMQNAPSAEEIAKVMRTLTAEETCQESAVANPAVLQHDGSSLSFS